MARGSVSSVWRNLWTFFTASITTRNVLFSGCVVVPAKLETAAYPQSKWSKDVSAASKKVGTLVHWAEGSRGSGAGCFTVAAATTQEESENQHRLSCFDPHRRTGEKTTHPSDRREDARFDDQLGLLLQAPRLTLLPYRSRVLPARPPPAPRAKSCVLSVAELQTPLGIRRKIRMSSSFYPNSSKLLRFGGDL